CAGELQSGPHLFRGRADESSEMGLVQAAERVESGPGGFRGRAVNEAASVGPVIQRGHARNQSYITYHGCTRGCSGAARLGAGRIGSLHFAVSGFRTARVGAQNQTLGRGQGHLARFLRVYTLSAGGVYEIPSDSFAAMAYAHPCVTDCSE